MVMQTDCPFCANGDVHTRIICEDAFVRAFPSNIPIVPGHTILCPTRHVMTLAELTEVEVTAIRHALELLQVSMRSALGAEGFNIAWNEGRLAGQSIDHLHLHIVPRTRGDAGITTYEPRTFLYRPGARRTSPAHELRAVATLIREHLPVEK